MTAYANQSFGATGSRLASLAPIIQSGKTFYLHHTGNDTYAGIDRFKPFKTLSAAHAAMSAGDVLRVLAGHDEVIAVSQALNKAQIKILGEGSGSSRPRFTANGAVNMWDISANDVWIENIYFPQSTSAPTSRVNMAALRVRMHNCQFDCGANDTNRAIRITSAADGVFIENTSFVSTATSVAAQPARGIEIVSTPDRLDLDSVSFDGGTVGWSSYALDMTAAATVGHLNAWNISLLNSSRFYLLTAGSVYYIHFTSASMSSYLEMAP